ncbi:MAG TPA: sulfatase-like hydrolase/transferase [Thermoanaerobaculia bacterium]|nr:sulfatase-like hydrolase/transferase [Thermoanaerobaculia bacterium]
MRPRNAFALLLLFAACRGAEAPAVLRFDRPPVILISIDTLRSDHLPAYGYKGVETPALDRFRGDAILFRNAYSHCPMTLPSHLSMLTGLLPPEHGVRDNVGFRFDSSKTPAIQSLLHKRGYATGAAVSSYVLRGETGISGGFDFYDDVMNIHPGARFRDYQRSGFATEEIAEKWIDAHKTSPLFFFFHIYEPHVPYDPPEPYRSRYTNRYDGEIATADAVIGRLFDHLRSQGLYDDALIIVTSDHGEGLGDHGEEQHSILLYREAIQVPLMLKLPGAKLAGTAVDAPAELIDILPTVTSLLGFEQHGAGGGISLVSLINSKAPWRSVYSESEYPRLHFGWSGLRSVVDGHMQLIESAAQNELYDLTVDKAEKTDIATSRRRELAALREALARFPAAEAAPSAVTPEESAKLAALGYVGSVRARGAATVNPRDRVAIVEKIREAMQAPPDRAVASMQSLTAEHPDMVEVWIQLGDLSTSLGRYPEAIEAYKGALSHTSRLSAEALLGLGDAYVQRGDIDNAVKSGELALSIAPREAHLLLANASLARGDVAKAEQEAISAAGNKPQPGDLVLLAEIAVRRGNFQQSLDLLSRAERRASDSGLTRIYRLDAVRGDTLARMNRPAEAVAAYEREIASFPNDLRAYSNVAVLYFVQGDRAAMQRALTRMTEANPTDAARRLAAKTRETLR